MSYRDDLASAHRRIEQLEEEHEEATRALDVARRALAEVEATPAPSRDAPRRDPTTARLARAVVATVGCTLLGYVATIALFDGVSPQHDAELAAAWAGALLPHLGSARLWWSRGDDRTFGAFAALRGGCTWAVWGGLFDGFSRFSHDFVFFWWAPLTSVGLLLVEWTIAWARPPRARRRVAT